MYSLNYIGFYAATYVQSNGTNPAPLTRPLISPLADHQQSYTIHQIEANVERYTPTKDR